MKRVLVLILFAVLAASCSQTRTSEQKWQLVKAYILNQEYPEVINGKNYKMRIDDVLVVDLDGDGIDEVLVVSNPHYRQSAAILIYQVYPNGKVRRVVEGLAPGPLVAINGEQLDSHTLGVAVDAKIDPPEGKQKLTAREQRELHFYFATKKKMHVVVYGDFFHMASRDEMRHGSFIDMQHRPVFDASETCEKFTFAPIADIEMVQGSESGKVHLMVLAGDELSIYRINSISEAGMLNRTVWIKKIPKGISEIQFNEEDGYFITSPAGKRGPIRDPEKGYFGDPVIDDRN